MLFPAALLALPSKASEQSCQGFGSAGPCRPPKREWERCAGWGHPAFDKAFTVRSPQDGSVFTSEVKWVNNWVSKMEREPGLACIVHARGLNAEGSQGFQIISPITKVNVKILASPSNVWITGGYSTLKPTSFDLYFTFKYNIQSYRMKSVSLKQQGENCHYEAVVV